mmetsp:Transcript_45431/g.52287  ORF Transcript_45431/g.52287 Transcript_45431/m.52287 type:complete len:450 (-) Transcript_45431:239-1588(-)
MGCASSKTHSPRSKKNSQEVPSSKVLVLRVSPLGEHSNTNKIINKFVDVYKNHFPQDTIIEKDISDGNSLKPYSAKRVLAKFATFATGDDSGVQADAKQEWADTKKLAQEFASFDKVVIGSPTWNFGIANQLKKYIDHIVQPHISFNPATYEGKLSHMTALIVGSSAGEVIGGPMDFNFTYLKTVLSSIGIADIREIALNNAANYETLSTSLEEKYREVTTIAKSFVRNPNAKLFPGIKIPIQPSSEKVSNGKKVLHVISSPLGDWSASRAVANQFLEEYQKRVEGATVKTLDLTADQLAPFNALRVQAKFAPYTNQEIKGLAKSEWEYTLELIKDFKEYDTYVFSVPVWNWGIPNHLKLYIDHLVQPFQTFDAQTYSGLLSGKKAFVISAAAGLTLGGERDIASPYMSAVLGLMGIKDVSHVYVNGTADQEKKGEIIGAASQEAIALI